MSTYRLEEWDDSGFAYGRSKLIVSHGSFVRIPFQVFSHSFLWLPKVAA